MKTKLLSFAFLISLFLISNANAVVRNINVGQGGGNTFSPSNVAANVGDTIKWTWVSGFHDVTSNSVPGGAASFASIQTGTVGFTFIYVVQVVGVYNYECTIHSGMNGSISVVSGVKQISSIVDVFELKQNFPNPFNPETKIKFSIPSNEFVTLSVYDLSGKEVANLVKNNLTAGVYEYDFNGANLSSGIYFYTIRAGNFTETKRMILVK
ncbi:MAG: T9SS type A sorting domain-containing protein [Ignavibacteria bacterium]|nr:T9SS type A sorting domain-containing protein [Ignavibacteria bacterium]